jgi:cobalt-precorrin-5B (C1)-methyltransferase
MTPDPPKKLRHGYTTGACAAAATKGASQMLRDQKLLDEVEICLPGGEAVTFALHGQRLTETGATCYVIKDAGDDPDVTNGAEIHATVDVDFFTDPTIIIKGGEGIGRVTKPGLPVPVGEWAINPVPRNMIMTGLKEALAMRCVPATLTVTISIPGGAELAKKTLNERLGIVGGLSILGTTGVVRPVSVSAWTDTIDCAIDVAVACQAPLIVLSTGRTSEMVAEKQLSGWPLPEEAFVMMGDHVGHALCSAEARGIPRVVLAGQFAKLLKIACGHRQTHVSSSELDLSTLAGWCRETAGLSSCVELCRSANTARQVLVDSGKDPALIRLVCDRARAAAGEMAPGLEVGVLLAGYGGEVLYCSDFVVTRQG